MKTAYTSHTGEFLDYVEKLAIAAHACGCKKLNLNQLDRDRLWNLADDKYLVSSDDYCDEIIEAIYKARRRISNAVAEQFLS